MRLRRESVIALALLTMSVALGPFEDRVSKLERTFRAADEYELFSLDPTWRKEDQAAATRPIATALESTTLPTSQPSNFHGYRVYGSVVIKEATEREKLNDALLKDAEFVNGVAGCFEPRHGARLTTHDAQGKHVTDVLICFSCSTLIAYEDGGPAQDSILRFVDAEDRNQPTFDAVLRTAGIQLAPTE